MYSPTFFLQRNESMQNDKKLKKIQIIYVSDKYIKYLSKYDNKVRFNKGQKRPYIGILFEVESNKYYAPLSSPREKFFAMKNNDDFIKIDGGKLGAINLNNMIPIHDSAIININFDNINDFKYKLLLLNQLDFFNKNADKIIKKATNLYEGYKNGRLRKEVFKRCCNFVKLEKYVQLYTPNMNIKNIKN